MYVVAGKRVHCYAQVLAPNFVTGVNIMSLEVTKTCQIIVTSECQCVSRFDALLITKLVASLHTI